MKKMIIILMLIVAGLALFFLCQKELERVHRAMAAVGLKAPDFELPELDTTGKGSSMIWRLSELKGKVVFINFWASWCDECKRKSLLCRCFMRRCRAGLPNAHNHLQG